MLEIAKQLDQDVLGVHELTIDLGLFLLQKVALLRYLRVDRLEVVEYGQIFEIEDDLAEGLG